MSGSFDKQSLLSSCFRIGNWEIDPATNRVRRGDEEVKLEPKVMAVLVSLASRAGRTVTRAELEEEVWRGTVVGYDAVSGTVQKLRKVFRDDPTRPHVIETVSKKGYRLVAPVSASKLAGAPITDQRPSAPPQGTAWRALLNGQRAVFTAFLILLAILTISILRWRGPDTSEPAGSAPKTVAVLPFRNVTGDPAQDYFADGMTDDLTTALASFGDLRVIARDSAFLYKGRELNARELADRLRARYLIDGSVRRTEGELRVNAHLIDAETGLTLWADSFSDKVDRVFEVQDRITEAIITALVGQLNVRDRQELARPRSKSPQAYDYFLYGRQQFFRYASAEENQRARQSFERAIVLDPEFALAHAMLAWTHVFDAMNGWGDNRKESLERALDLGGKAIALEEAMPVAHFVRGVAYRELGDWEHALAEAERAIEFDPNYAAAYVLLATLNYFDGRPEKGLTLMQKAIALHPKHPYNYSFHLGQACYILARYDEAIEAFEDVLRSNPRAERAHIWLAAALAKAGRQADAAWELEEARAVNPKLTLDRIRKIYPFSRNKDLEHFLSGLRQAGLTP